MLLPTYRHPDGGGEGGDDMGGGYASDRGAAGADNGGGGPLAGGLLWLGRSFASGGLRSGV